MGEAWAQRGRNAVLAAFGQQIAWCRNLGSPFTAEVVSALADDIAAGGTTAGLVDGWPDDPVADALPLRLAGALHALALSGDNARLAGHYPSVTAASPEIDRPALRAAILASLAERADIVRAFIASPPQTNEVGRSAVLLGGFLRIAATTGLPLRLLEVGASAGLNLLWDRFRYHVGTARWGDQASPVLLAPEWSGPTPPVAEPLRVAERRGCDIAPIDLEDPAQRLRLRSYVWADQTERLRRLDGAMTLARAAGTRVERADAADWVEARTRERAEGRVTVLYHSIMWQYLPPATRAAVTKTMKRAGERADAAAPLAWLRFEPDDRQGPPDLRLTTWPDRRDERLATAQAHGGQMTWLVGGDPSR